MNEYLAGHGLWRVDHFRDEVLAHLFVWQVSGPGNDAQGIALRPACGAIIFPELFLRNGLLDISMGNTRLLAGLVAVLVAWFSKNTLVTIIAGMVALFLWQYFL
jgi:hypothetical protein